VQHIIMRNDYKISIRVKSVRFSHRVSAHYRISYRVAAENLPARHLSAAYGISLAGGAEHCACKGFTVLTGTKIARSFGLMVLLRVVTRNAASGINVSGQKQEMKNPFVGVFIFEYTFLRSFESKLSAQVVDSRGLGSTTLLFCGSPFAYTVRALTQCIRDDVIYIYIYIKRKICLSV